MKSIFQTDPTFDSEFVVLYGVPWEAYEGIVEALGELHLRHTYDEGTLELRRVVGGVAWENYLKFLDATREYHLRHTYDEGALEMMSPRKDHDWVHRLIGRMIEGMALVLEIPIQSIGSTTLRAATGQRGLQPDEAYYVAHEAEVRGKTTYIPESDPPPDLVVEVDVTHSSVARLPVFAQVRVPEIWRHDGQKVRFYRLTVLGDYESIDRSDAFPFIGPEDVTRHLELRYEMDENSLVRAFVEWAKSARQHRPG